MGTLTLNETTHEYRVDDRPVLGVSQILALAGLTDMTWVTEEALKRGSYVHTCIEYHVQGDLDESKLDPKLLGYVNAWKAFERESGFRVRQIDGVWQSEIRRHHPIYKYAGTVDHLGDIVTPNYLPRYLVVDVKSGEPSDWHGVQLAGYAMLSDFPATSKRPERANLYVRPDGSYRFVERKDRNDFEIFKAAITIAQTRVAWGLAK